MPMHHILDEFASSFRRHGLTPPDNILADGRIHRFRSGPEHAENGFYRLTVLPAHKGGEIGFGTIGCWKRGLNEKWSSHQRGEIGEADRTAIKRARAEQKKVEAQEAAAAIERGKKSGRNPARQLRVIPTWRPRASSRSEFASTRTH